MSQNLIPLSDWINGVRHELSEARAKYEAMPKDARTIGLNLEEVTLEAQIASEASASGGIKVQLYVVNIEGGTSGKTMASQKVVLKFKPSLSTEEDITMGNPLEKEEFH